jgi:hypothetical protein
LIIDNEVKKCCHSEGAKNPCILIIVETPKPPLKKGGFKNKIFLDMLVIYTCKANPFMPFPVGEKY